MLETHNIIIGVQDKNKSIKIRCCVIKIQKIDGQLKVKLKIQFTQKSHYLSTSCACDKCLAKMKTTCEIL